MEGYVALTKDKKEILKQHMGIVKFEGYSELVYEANKNIMVDKLDKFKNEIDLSNSEIELLELYNEFCSRF